MKNTSLNIKRVVGLFVIFIWMFVSDLYLFEIQKLFVKEFENAIYIWDASDIGLVSLIIYIVLVFVQHKVNNKIVFESSKLKSFFFFALVIFISVSSSLLFIGNGNAYTSSNQIVNVKFFKMQSTNDVMQAKSAQVSILYEGDSTVPWDGVRFEYKVKFDNIEYHLISSDDFRYWDTIKELDDAISNNKIDKKVVGIEYLETIKEFNQVDMQLNSAFGVCANYDLIIDIMKKDSGQ